VFGVPLEELLAYERAALDPDTRIPLIMQESLEYLEREEVQTLYNTLKANNHTN
jgi:hypothetical protein